MRKTFYNGREVQKAQVVEPQKEVVPEVVKQKKVKKVSKKKVSKKKKS